MESSLTSHSRVSPTARTDASATATSGHRTADHHVAGRGDHHGEGGKDDVVAVQAVREQTVAHIADQQRDRVAPARDACREPCRDRPSRGSVRLDEGEQQPDDLHRDDRHERDGERLPVQRVALEVETGEAEQPDRYDEPSGRAKPTQARHPRQQSEREGEHHHELRCDVDELERARRHAEGIGGRGPQHQERRD